MRRMKRIAMLLGASFLFLALVAVPAPAKHRPSSYCSQSGDYCIQTYKKDGVRKFEIRMAAKYFNRYTLCVFAPDETKACREFRIRDRGKVYGDVVAWKSFFPNKGPGAYDVRWKTADGPLGRRLGFHVMRDT